MATGVNFNFGLQPHQATERSGRACPVSYESAGALAAVSDFAAIMVSAMAAGVVYHLVVFGNAGDISQHLGLGAAVAGLFLPLMTMHRLYQTESILRFQSQIGPTVLVWAAVWSFLLVIAFTLKISDMFSRGAVLTLAVAGLGLVLMQRYSLSRYVSAAIEQGRLRTIKVLMVGDERGLECGAKSLSRYGFQIVATCAYNHPDQARITAAQIIDRVHGSAIDEIHVALDWERQPGIRDLLAELRTLPLRIRWIADPGLSEILRHPQLHMDPQITIELQRAPLSLGEQWAKRVFDLAFAAAGLIACAPLLAMAALAVRLDSDGPVLFRQTRRGFNGRPFRIYKFRTMSVLEDGPVIRQAQCGDARVTRVGRWLRRSSIDELPQLINVLQGNMSLVGPRPHASAHDDEYMRLIGNYALRHHMKPGITGWAQVNGFRGETPSLGLMQRRVELDIWYVANWSLWLDCWVVLRTVVEICRSRSAF